MKKIYMLILLTFISLSGMSYAMEQDISEEKEDTEAAEIKNFALEALAHGAANYFLEL